MLVVASHLGAFGSVKQTVASTLQSKQFYGLSNVFQEFQL